MLTLPLEDDSPVADRHSGFHLPINGDAQLSQILFGLVSARLGEIRFYSFATGRLDWTKGSDLPPKISLQTFAADLADSLEAQKSAHVPSAERSPDGQYRIFLMRYISPWEMWDNCNQAWASLDRRCSSLQAEVRR